MGSDYYADAFLPLPGRCSAWSAGKMVAPGRCIALSLRFGLASIRMAGVVITVSRHAMATVAVSRAPGASSKDQVAARAW
jgi:hypothetical protein